MKENRSILDFTNKPILNERFEKTLYFGSINCSGLGDRLHYICLISILAYTQESNCILTWYNMPGHDSRSYSLDIVKKYISFPKWVDVQASETQRSSSNCCRIDGPIEKVGKFLENGV